ncbi:MAG: glycosyltransferase family 4 protein [Acidobacteriota bacterium]
MLTIAYLANQFPSDVEPYVGDEIVELRRRGSVVIAGSVRSPKDAAEMPDIILQRAALGVLGPAMWLLLTKWHCVLPLLIRIVSGREPVWKRIKALLHTLLGASYATLLRGHNVDRIHVHHGYFGSWIGMTAARLLHVGFSMTLHGSDLLRSGSYLDLKLAQCDFCVTISAYNRDYILQRFPDVDPRKILVSRLGVDPVKSTTPASPQMKPDLLNLLAVGRLHQVKDHAFLLRVCAELMTRQVPFFCRIAGNGPERRRLESLIEEWGLQERVTLLGHIGRSRLPALYDAADVVVLTSRSEGIPVVLMEAMARGKIVLAPAITGIPELVRAGETGFLYQPGSLQDCLAKLHLIHLQMTGDESGDLMHDMRRRAVAHVDQNFNRAKNLHSFADLFLQRTAAASRNRTHADFILQQI